MWSISRINNQIKGIFVLPKKRYYIGKAQYGTPYFFPSKYNDSIIKIRRIKNKHKSNGNYNFDFMEFNISIGYPIYIKGQKLGWKEKNGPRFEWCPAFHIFIFNLQICIYWDSPLGSYDNDEYWEQVLWFLEYSDMNIDDARETYDSVGIWKEEYIKK